MQLVITPGGAVRCVYSEEINLAELVMGDNYPSSSRCLTEKCYHQYGVGNSGPRDPSQVPRGR